MLKNLLTKEYINCNLRLMNDQSRPCRKGRGERGRLARSVWRPAEHIFARYRSHRATLRASTIQRQMVENRGEVRRETPRTTTGTVALPLHSNPALSQRVAARRSDKILLKADIHRPFFASRLAFFLFFVVRDQGQSRSVRLQPSAFPQVRPRISLPPTLTRPTYQESV